MDECIGLIFVVPVCVILVLLPIDILWGTIDIVENIIDISPWFIIDILQAVNSITVVLPAVFWSCGRSDTLESLGNFLWGS